MTGSMIMSRLSLAFVLAMLGLATLDARFTWPAEVHLFPLFTAAGFVFLAGSFFMLWRKGIQRAWTVRYLVWAGLILALISLYLKNPTHRWQEGVGLLPVHHLVGWPGSAAPGFTATSLRFAAAMAVVLGCSLLLETRDKKALLVIIVLGALAMSGLMLWQRLTPKPFPIYEYTGVFVSENHYAAFANMVFPVALAMGARIQYQAFQKGQVSSPAICLYGIAALLAVSVYFSRSRAGLAITLVLLAMFLAWQWRLRCRHPFIAPPVIPAVKIVMAISVLLVGLYLGAMGWKYLKPGAHEFSYRGQILSDTLAMWKDRPWWGVGPGAFAAAFPYYQDASIQDRFVRHAHCEPLEFLAEYGVGGALLVVAASLFLLPGGQVRSEENDPVPSFVELEIPALGMALGGCLLHSLVDFPFRQPQIGLLCFTLAGMLLSSRWKTGPLGVHTSRDELAS